MFEKTVNYILKEDDILFLPHKPIVLSPSMQGQRKLQVRLLQTFSC